MGNDVSVIQFREQAKIITTGKPPNNADFWRGIWTAPVPLDCVFSEITPDVIRTMKRKKPINLTVLISQAKDEIIRCSTGEQGVIRCLEILTHIMPIVLEPDEKSLYAEKYLFSLDNRFCVATGTKKIIGDELLAGLLDLLFEPNFTINENLAAIDTTKDFIPIGTHIWAPGLGAATLPNTPKGKWVSCSGGNRVYERRTSILRCLLACICGDLYTVGSYSPEVKERAENRFVETLLNSSVIAPQANAFFFSVINTILSYDPVGWGLPYNYLFSSDSPEKLVNVCIEVLTTTLAHSNGAPVALHTSHPNYFIQIIRKLKKKESFSFLYNGIVRLLENSILASDSMFPYARHQMQCADEMIIIMFIAMFYNRKFVKHILTLEDISKFMIPLLHYVVTNCKNKESEKGIYASLMCFLILSEDREFGNALNLPYNGYVPSSLVPILNTPSYTLADVFILSFSAVISASSLDSPIAEGFLNVLSNVSPLIRDISTYCSEKLCSMFIRASKPSFIVKKKSNHKYSTMLLEIISKIIGYEPQSSSNLIYSLVCYKDDFLAFKNLTFETLVETKDISLANAKKAQQSESGKEESEKQEGEKPGQVDEPENAKKEEKEKEKDVDDALYDDDDDDDGEDNGEEEEGNSSNGPKKSDVDDDGPISDITSSGSTTGNGSDESVKKKPEEAKDDSAHKKPFHEAAAFVPTLEWFKKWRDGLSFEVILAMYDVIEPRIASLLTGTASDKNNIKKMINGMNFVGLLPIMGGISLRHYIHNDSAAEWLTQYAWEVVVDLEQPTFFSDIKSTLLSETLPYSENFVFNFKKKIKKITVAKTKSSLIAAEIVSSPASSPMIPRRTDKKKKGEKKGGKFIEDESDSSEKQPPKEEEEEEEEEEEVAVVVEEEANEKPSEKKDENENNNKDDDDDEDDGSDDGDDAN